MAVAKQRLALKESLSEQIPRWRQRMKGLLENHRSDTVGSIPVESVVGGMRGLKVMLCDTSNLDPEEGIRFRGYTIPEVRERLPRPEGGTEPYPTGLWALLLTGEIPNRAVVLGLEDELRARQPLPQYVKDVIKALPVDTHPMTQFSAAILALHRESDFVRRYNAGMTKDEYWDPMFEDSLTLLAKLPSIAAYVYRRVYRSDIHIEPDRELDWGANMAHMMGNDDPEFYELMRLYLLLHSDHEGGNVSAHASTLVGSALSSVFYSVSAGMNGLAGPLHGLANQECLKWVVGLMRTFDGVPTKEQIREFTWDTLQRGQVIPGYGHAVLRKTDPRYMAQREFAQKHMPDDPLFQTVSNVFEVVPKVLQEHGKAKNPWPNVDAHSGALLSHYGVEDVDFYTVLFGVSRTMGLTAHAVLNRALGMPLERPKSVTLKWLEEHFERKG